MNAFKRKNRMRFYSPQENEMILTARELYDLARQKGYENKPKGGKLCIDLKLVKI